MQFQLTIDCDNAAFQDNPSELADILRKLAERLESGQPVDGYTLRDSNGNNVGMSQFSDLTEDDF